MKRIAVILTVAGIGAPAFAGGPVVIQEEPPIVVAPVSVAPAADWTGFYAGAHLGYGNFDGSRTTNVTVDEQVQVVESLLDLKGAVYGAQIGYRWDLGNTVMGVELSHSASNVDQEIVANGLVVGAYELDRKTDLKLQLGYDMGQSLVYATAGASWAKVAYTDALGGAASASDNGWLLGLGYDYDLGNNWVVGAEYNYVNYDNFDNTGLDLDGNTIAIRANYRF